MRVVDEPEPSIQDSVASSDDSEDLSSELAALERAVVEASVRLYDADFACRTALRGATYLTHTRVEAAKEQAVKDWRVAVAALEAVRMVAVDRQAESE